MNNATCSTVGRLLFAIAILAIGIIHIVTKNFPTGLLPVPAELPGRMVLVYGSAAALIAAAVLIISKKYMYSGAVLAGIIWLIYLLALHLPRLIMTYDMPDNWTPTFEVLLLFCGALLLAADADPANNNRFKRVLIADYLFAIVLLVFFVLHFKYTQFIVMLIPSWLPFRFFWANVVTVAFFLSSLSLFIRKLVRLSSLLLALMFLIWFFILHLPRVIGDIHSEPEWTSMFVVLAASGVALLVAGSQKQPSA
jgi:uncharacterized membrane protein